MTTAPQEHKHPNARTYWITAFVLAVLTAIEISIPYVAALDGVRGVLLVTFGFAKFLIVVAVFMHLKYDAPRYRTYFLMGLVGAIIVFAVVLATFRAF